MRWQLGLRLLPIGSALVVTGAGMLITLEAVLQTGRHPVKTGTTYMPLAWIQPNENEDAMPDSNTQVVAALLEAWNAHDLQRIASFYAADYLGEDVGHSQSQYGSFGRTDILAEVIGCIEARDALEVVGVPGFE